MEKKMIILILLAPFLLIAILFFIRAFSSKYLDDVSPEISCSENLLEKADILFVIPKFNNKSINENKNWCEKISSLNKTPAMHGLYHNYNEFSQDKSKEYLEEAIKIFEACFNFSPEEFKPPQLKISKNNRKLIKSFGLKLHTATNTIFHKVYHCDDTGIIKNRWADLF